MRCSYKDIRAGLGEPFWWDEFAVPRYCEFHPNEIAKIHAYECCLLEIACQNCGRRFLVCLSRSPVWDEVGGGSAVTLAERISEDWMTYADPPNVGCCGAGPSMTSNVLRVVEYWKWLPWEEWRRNRLYEKVFTEETD